MKKSCHSLCTWLFFASMSLDDTHSLDHCVSVSVGVKVCSRDARTHCDHCWCCGPNSTSYREDTHKTDQEAWLSHALSAYTIGIAN